MIKIRTTLFLLALALLIPAGSARAQSDPALLAPPFDPSTLDQRAMMERMQSAMTPSRHHEMLDVLAGEWETETEMRMGGAGGEPVTTTGTVTNEWILGGRFLRSTGETTMMGQPLRGVITYGYDTFAGRYQMHSMSTMGTAMQQATGFPARDGRAILFHGTMDEAMLGVRGRTVRYVLRLEDADHYVLEVHDLHIGEGETKVLETRHRRKGRR